MIRLAIRVEQAHCELVLAELLELAPSGVEELKVGDQLVEYAVYGAPGELPELPDLRAAAGDALVEISTSEIPDDWSERWRSFHRPVLIESPSRPRAGGAPRASAAISELTISEEIPALYVRPPWESPSQRPGVKEIVIDPGQAFGTGAHATTRLCLELLLELAASEPGRGRCLDIGTGSGVLAIAAAQLGYRPVLGLDHERESVTATRENALANGVRIEVRHFDLRADPLPWDGAEGVVLANLLRPLLLELSQTFAAAPRHMLASGLLVAEADELAQAFHERLGMREHARREGGEWSALWLVAGTPRPHPHFETGS
jgi:ribosomal protein L11 methyltransferase